MAISVDHACRFSTSQELQVLSESGDGELVTMVRKCCECGLIWRLTLRVENLSTYATLELACQDY